jgi:hypothetical protein
MARWDREDAAPADEAAIEVEVVRPRCEGRPAWRPLEAPVQAAA